MARPASGWDRDDDIGRPVAVDCDPSMRRIRQPRACWSDIQVMAVAVAGLVADLEAVGRRLEDPHHLVDGAALGPADDLPGLAEDADRDALIVDIETGVEHGCLLNSLDLGTIATGFQVTRLTGASLKVSTPSHAPTRPPSLPLADWPLDRP